MQHQFWVTKQSLSQRFGRKEDECITSSDTLLDSKLELFRNIETSCVLLQKIINKYQECICYLSQETNLLGRFLKENSETAIQSGEIILVMGKSFVFCAQQLLFLHEPLMRFHEELDTFCQRAIGDTLQNVLQTEKSRTEFRATLLWMKNVSQQLDPDTSKQLEKFKKVQAQVKRKKKKFDKSSMDCLQKVELLAAARCNMFNYVLHIYQNRIIKFFHEAVKVFTMDKNLENKDNIGSLVNQHMKLIDGHQHNIVEKFSCEMQNSLTDNNGGQRSSSASFKKKTNYDTLNSVLLTCKEIEHKTLNDLDIERNLEINSNVNGRDTFLPPDLLTQSLTTASDDSKIKNDCFKIKGHVERMIDRRSHKDVNTTTWFNFLEDLDPVTQDTLEKSANKFESSFV